MRQNHAFPLFKRYRFIAIIAVLLLISGCGAVNGTIDAGTPGFFNHYVVFPFSYLIQHIASFLFFKNSK